MNDEALRKAVAEAVKGAGGVAALARKLGISQPAISQWDRVPVERVKAVSEITGMSPHQLRPDIFGIGEAAA